MWRDISCLLRHIEIFVFWYFVVSSRCYWIYIRSLPTAAPLYIRVLWRKRFVIEFLLPSCDIWQRWFKEFCGRRLLERIRTVFRRVTSIYTQTLRVTKARRVTKSYKCIESYKDKKSRLKRTTYINVPALWGKYLSVCYSLFGNHTEGHYCF